MRRWNKYWLWANLRYCSSVFTVNFEDYSSRLNQVWSLNFDHNETKQTWEDKSCEYATKLSCKKLRYLIIKSIQNKNLKINFDREGKITKFYGFKRATNYN